MDTVTTLPRSRPLRVADLAVLPDDGHRYELLDGSLLVTPSPSWGHQSVVVRLCRLLDDARPPGLMVLVAPFDVVLSDDTVLQPDVLVARRNDLVAHGHSAPPLLAVEVLSPSTRRIDQLLKPARYAASGIASYWIVDQAGPSLVAYELDSDGTYQETATVRGDELFSTEEPFTITFTPSDLVIDA